MMILIYGKFIPHASDECSCLGTWHLLSVGRVQVENGGLQNKKKYYGLRSGPKIFVCREGEFSWYFADFDRPPPSGNIINVKSLIGDFIVVCQGGGVSEEPPWLQAATRHGPLTLSSVNRWTKPDTGEEPPWPDRQTIKNEKYGPILDLFD